MNLPRRILVLVLAQAGLYMIVLVDASRHHPNYLFPFRAEMLWPALWTVSTFGLAAILFAFVPFSFGYALCYYFYLMIIGFLWVNGFTTLEYHHLVAGAFVALSACAFSAPALTIKATWSGHRTLSIEVTQILMYFFVALCFALVIICIGYSFHLFDLTTYTEFRDELLRTASIRNSIDLPKSLRYAVGIMSNAIIPFVFAFFVERRQYWLSALSLLLLTGFFPMTLTKTALVSPLWLIFVAVTATFFEARIASILTMFIPMATGLVLMRIWPTVGRDLFELLDFRLLVVPSAALSFYSDFFSHHDTTAFCQIGLVARLVGCPYEELGLVMSKAYGLGHYNASLFATEGIASVGLLLSPISAFVCGLVIAGANRLTTGLPPRFILVSSGVITPMFLNVPFSIMLLTHGAAVLFLLWYLVPRRLFDVVAACNSSSIERSRGIGS